MEKLIQGVYNEGGILNDTFQHHLCELTFSAAELEQIYIILHELSLAMSLSIYYLTDQIVCNRRQTNSKIFKSF